MDTTGSSPSSDLVTVGDIVLLSCVSSNGKSPMKEGLFAYSEGILQASVRLGDYQEDKTRCQCSLFRIELDLTETGGELMEEDKTLERKANEFKIEKSQEALRYGMSVRLRHVHTGNHLVIDTLNPSARVGFWDVLVDKEAKQTSSHITLQTLDKSKKRTGDEIQYGEAFVLTFQVDSLTYFSNVQEDDFGLSVFTSDEKGAWKFLRPMKQQVKNDDVELFKFVKFTHMEMDMTLGTSIDGKGQSLVLMADASQPSTVWQLEPMEAGPKATPLKALYLKHVASQRYLNADLTFSESPGDYIQLAIDSEADSIQYEGLVRLRFPELNEMITIDQTRIKASVFDKLILFQTKSFDAQKNKVEVQTKDYHKAKEALFYVELGDQEEARFLSIVAKATIMLDSLGKKIEEIMSAGQFSSSVIRFLHGSRLNFDRVLDWLTVFINSANADNYSKRRAMIVTSGMHKSLGNVCNLIVGLSKSLSTGMEGLQMDAVERNLTKEGLETLKPTLRRVIELLSDVAKDSVQVANSMIRSISAFENLWEYDDSGVFSLLSSIYSRVSPLWENGRQISMSKSKIVIQTWVTSLLTFSELTQANVFQQAMVLFRLRMSCFQYSRFLPRCAELIQVAMQDRDCLPLMYVKEFNEEFYLQPRGLTLEDSDRFLENNPKLRQDPSSANIGDPLFLLSQMAGLPGYQEYVYNYLVLLSCLGRVHQELLGINVSTCVKLAKAFSAGVEFCTCGLKLVSVLLIAKDRRAVNSADRVQNNCYSISRLPPKESQSLKFSQDSDSPTFPLVKDILDWVATVLLKKSQPYDDKHVKETSAISYLTALLQLIQDLITYDHCTRFFFFAVDRCFPYFLLGFSDMSGQASKNWISKLINSTITKMLEQEGSELRSTLVDCYKSVMKFGMFMNKVKRSFQLDELARTALEGGDFDDLNKERSIENALTFPIGEYLAGCKVQETLKLAKKMDAMSFTIPLLNLIDPIFNRLNTYEVLTNAPNIKQLLYRVAILRSDFSPWQNDDIKGYIESVYGEYNDIMHLLCKSELLDDAVQGRIISIVEEILKKKDLEAVLIHFEQQLQGDVDQEVLNDCMNSMKELCDLVHPLRRADPMEVTACRNIMRHLQVQQKVYRLWTIAHPRSDDTRFHILERYCIQFCYNVTYDNACNQRELQKLFSKSLFTLEIPQLADLLQALGRFDFLLLSDKLVILDEIIQKQSSFNRENPRTLNALYFLEVLLFDFQGQPVQEIQAFVQRFMLERMSAYLADLWKYADAIGPTLRLVALTCKDNPSMSSQSKLLFKNNKFHEMVNESTLKILRGAWDFLGYVWKDEIVQHETEVSELLQVSLRLLNDSVFCADPRLREVAEENACDLLFTDPAIMTVQSIDPKDEVVDAFKLLGTLTTRLPGGMIPMLMNVFPNAESIEKLPKLREAMKKLHINCYKLWKTVVDLELEQEDALDQSTRTKINVEAFRKLLELFLAHFKGSGTLEHEPSQFSLEKVLTLEQIMGKQEVEYENHSVAMGKLIIKLQRLKGLPEDSVARILSEQEAGQRLEKTFAQQSVKESKVFIAQSRAFLRTSEDKRFYYWLMNGLLRNASDPERVNLALFMLEHKVTLDVVKTIISSSYENKLSAIKLLIALLVRQPEHIITRFRDALTKSDLGGDLFRAMKNDLGEVTNLLETRKETRDSGRLQDDLTLLKIEFAGKVLELLQILSDFCNREFQIYLMQMPATDRGSIMFEVTKQFVALNSGRETHIGGMTGEDADLLETYNAFNLDKTRLYLKFVNEKFQISPQEALIPKQPSSESQLNALTLGDLNALIEMVTGPFLTTQTFLGTFANLYLTFNSLLKLAWSSHSFPVYTKLYGTSIKALLALLDGSPDWRVVQYLSTYLDLKMLLDHLKEIYTDITTKGDSGRLNLGVNVFMLLLKLKYQESDGEIEELKLFTIDNTEELYYRYFIKYVGYVEIAKEDSSIECIYFPIPHKLRFMTLQSKNELLFDVDRSSQQHQIRDFMKRVKIWLKEIDHQELLHAHSIIKKVTTNWEFYGKIAYFLVVVINLTLLFGTTESTEMLSNSAFDTVHSLLIFVTVLGVTQMLISSLHVTSYVLEFLPNIFMRIGFAVNISEMTVKPIETEDSGKLTIPNLIIGVLLKTSFLYYLVYFLISVLALMHPYFYLFLLLDIVQKSSDLVTILQSITTNVSQLLMTVCLALIWIYIFSVFGYVFLSSSYRGDDVPCGSLFACLTSTFSRGVQSGGGIGDELSPVPREDPMFWPRFVFDLLYFIIIIVVLLNVLFGIILDTFGELRDNRNARNEDIANTCYICGQNRNTLELKANGWKYHFTGEHSPFAYLAFLIYLEDKEVIDCNGLEKYVKDKIEKKDTTFVPTSCKALESAGS